jgi:TPR repeat protein
MVEEVHSGRNGAPSCGSLTEKMRELRRFSGDPSLEDLHRISKQLATHYQDERFTNATVLAPATVSDVLAGKRKKPPKRAFLVAFVLACEWHAWTVGRVTTEWASDAKRTGPPDPDMVLLYWEREHERALALLRPDTAGTATAAPDSRIQAAKTDMPGAAASSTAVTAGTEPLPAPVPASVTQPVITTPEHLEPAEGTTTAGSGASVPAVSPYESFNGPSGTSDMRKPIQGMQLTEQPITLSQQRMNRLFGALGLQLYERAEEGHVEASYRLGALLCAADAPREGIHYLDKAKVHRHSGAAALRRILDPARLCERAQYTVYEFARTAHTENEVHTAICYGTVAARNGHAEAAHMLATLLVGLDQPELADTWLRIAARLGHRRARQSVGSTDLISRGLVSSGIDEAVSATLARHQPEPRFSRANATQPIDMDKLFAEIDAEDHAQAVRRLCRMTQHPQHEPAPLPEAALKMVAASRQHLPALPST